MQEVSEDLRFPFEFPDRYRPSPRHESIWATEREQYRQVGKTIVIDDSHISKWSPTLLECHPIDFDKFNGKTIVIDFITDNDPWDIVGPLVWNKRQKEMKPKRLFDHQQNKAINFGVITIGIQKTDEVFVFADPSWQLKCDEKSKVFGWIDEVIEILNRVGKIIVFDDDLFFGILRFYLPYEQVMMDWRMLAHGLSPTLKKKFKCWKRLQKIAAFNSVRCATVYKCRELMNASNFELCVQHLLGRLVALDIVYRLSQTSSLSIPISKSSDELHQIGLDFVFYD